jgi:hypothetical protein
MSDADYLDFAALPYMTWAGDTSNPSIGIGVVRAWDYLRQLGLPPAEGTWEPARVAVLDLGFALDPVTGVGSLDWPGLLGSPPLQVDTVDSDNRAGSLKEGWHGEGTFGVCCATPRNRFGGAGRGGEYVRPIAVRVALGYSDIGAGVWSAINMAADVINISIGGDCNWLCQVWERGRLDSAIGNASFLGISVVASAGNGPDNATTGYEVSDDNLIPCKLPSVI